ncbi:MAG TPA: cytochrome b/b6 domain-containing protein [Dissulfurispiraceae bacterium]|nr:cytochrome b/b6 domain-containing protein [Dissulfurispiraceae bacterium]
MEEKGGNQHIRRFGPYRIVEHLALIVIFLVLAMTGLPQKFYHLGISQSVIVILGGIDNLRLLHHLSAMLFIGLAAEHVIVNFVGVTFMDWEPSMLVTLKDAQDSFQNVRYYLGLTHEPAGCGRYTYKEKGIYWFVLIGSVQMIITGLVLWFPVAFTRYLPGIFVPLSKMVHTSEAMLIFMLVVTWHIYDSMLNPDVFPINKSIFTGYIGTRQMKRLHPMESATLREEGSADQVDRSIPV